MSEPSSRRTVALEVVTDATTCPIAVDVPAGATWGEVRAALCAEGFTVPHPAYVGSTQLADDIECGVGDLGAGAVICATPSGMPSPHLIELLAIEGPHVGARLPLDAGKRVIGRGAEADLHLSDPALSRAHCLVELSQGRTIVTDQWSTNGVLIDDQPLPPGRETELRMHQRLSVGSSTFTLRLAVPPDKPTRYDERGRIEVSPAREVIPQLRPVVVADPTPPRALDRPAFPWVSATVPLVLAVVVALVMHNPIFMLFALLGPVMALTQYGTDRKQRRRQRASDAQAYSVQLRAARDARASALRTELTLRQQRCPSVAHLIDAIAVRMSPAWSRNPEDDGFLLIRVGTGSVPSLVGTSQGPGDCVEHRCAPVEFDLGRHRRTCIAGAAGMQDLMLLTIIAQLAALHSPRHVRIVAVTSRPWFWRPIAQLPHVQSDCATTIFETSEWEQALNACQENSIATLLVVDHAPQSALGHALQSLDTESVFVVAVNSAPIGADFSSRIEVHDPQSAWCSDHTGDFAPDLLTADAAATLFGHLARLADANPARHTSLPTTTSLRTLTAAESALDITNSADLVAHWRAATGSPTALTGATESAALRVDLAKDGPHALVAGTTGAGKSELLQTLITSLAVSTPPDRLSFVLVDYKGGAAFKDCARLPHTVGLVTDLDEHLTRRALRSLNAEIHRRETILAAAGAKELADLELMAPQSCPPRLVLVIDEFRVLAEELPDFMAGLVRIATVGRSMGIHLVLATQRPAGVVSADIRANVNLRIALRVRDDADSHDVIGAVDAARLSAAAPGRAIMRSGSASAITFQTARIGGAQPREQRAIRVGTRDWRGAVDWRGQVAENSVTDLELSVTAMQSAASVAGIEPVARPWLPPLSDELHLHDLPDATAALSGAAADDLCVLGLRDEPDRQRQSALGWSPTGDGNLAIVGGPRSGRSSTLLTLAHSIERHQRAHVYVVDGAGALAALDELGHVGAVIRTDEVGRLSALIDWLQDEIRSRQSRLDQSAAQIVVLIDGWEGFVEASDAATMGALADGMQRVLRDGPAVRIHCAISGGRTLATGRVSALLPTTICLRLADPTDALVIGLRATDLPDHQPAGRAVLPASGDELQVLAPTTFREPQPAPTGLRPFDRLPALVSLGEVASDAGTLTLGQSLGNLAVTTMDGGCRLLIAGPGRSGKTNGLRVLATQFAESRPILWIGARAPELPSRVQTLRPEQDSELSQWLAAHDNPVVLFDDLDRSAGSPSDGVLTRYATSPQSQSAVIAASGAASEFAASFRGLAAELKRDQRGVLLKPARRDGDVFGIRLPPTDGDQPGRGQLVVDGECAPIQLALVR